MAKRGRPKKTESQDLAKSAWYIRFARGDDPRLDN
jgi:hypothetical protein